jgi:hypothetical protein
MADAVAGVSAFGSGAAVSVRAVPPPVWVILAAIAGAFVLLWHSFRNDIEDTTWTDPKQPPENLPVGMVVPPCAATTDFGTDALRARRPFHFARWTDDMTAGASAQIPVSGRLGALGWVPGRG